MEEGRVQVAPVGAVPAAAGTAHGARADLQADEMSVELGGEIWELARTQAPLSRAESHAHGLGWLSLGLGFVEMTVAGALAKLVLGRNRRGASIVRVIGVRELAIGLGLLGRPRSSSWLWARVAGDAVDLALLGLARRRVLHKAPVTRALAGVAGITLMDVLAALELRHQEETQRAKRGIYVTKSIFINRSPSEVYRFWRNFEKLPRFMAHLQSVEPLEGNRSRWTTRGPAGATFCWETEIVEERPYSLLSWRSFEGADVPNAGTVRFSRAPGGRGTKVELALLYRPPAGKLGAGFAKLFGREPAQQIDGDLRRLKQVLETGEVLHSDASIHRRPHPARPPEKDKGPAGPGLQGRAS